MISLIETSKTMTLQLNILSKKMRRSLTLFIFTTLFSGCLWSQDSWIVKDSHPSVFTENKGQFHPANGEEVQFGAHLGFSKILFDKEGYSIVYEARYDAQEEHERREKMERGLAVKPREQRVWRAEFVDANPSVEILGTEIQPFSFNYGLGPEKEAIKSSTYKKVTFRNIYPKIDIVFSFSDERSIKYNIIIKPGGDPKSIKINLPEAEYLSQTSETEISLASDYFELKESIPATFYSDNKEAVNCNYEISDKTISFKLTDHDESRTMVIDPMLILISPFTSGNDYYKLQYDNFGNVWVMGELGDEIAKFDSDGNLLWVFINTGPYAGIGSHGDFIVRPTTGECYLCPYGFPHIIRIDALGNQMNDWTSAYFPYHEMWTLMYDEINDLVITGRGLGGGMPPVIGQIDPNLTAETATILPLPPHSLFKDPVFMELSPDGTTLYTLIAGGETSTTTIWDGYGNVMLSIPVSDFSAVTTFQTYHEFEEVNNSDYSIYNFTGAFNSSSNCFNGIAVDEEYVYTYDGKSLKKFDRTTETLADSISTGLSLVTHAGIALDGCGGLYVGAFGEVLKYNTDLDLLSSIPMPDTVIDVRIANDHIYACGIGFVKSVDLPKSLEANFLWENQCLNEGALNFTDASTALTGDLASWEWNFGDGTGNSIAANPSYEYSSGGSFNVSLIVTNEYGCSDTIIQTVTVYPEPMSDFDYSLNGLIANATDLSGCVGDSIIAINLSTVDAPDSIVVYDWNFDDGGSSSELHPTHIYSTDGSFDIELIVTTNNGCVDTFSTPVNIYPIPEANFITDNVCQNETAIFYDVSTPSGTITNYQWDFGDASANDYSSGPVNHGYATHGTYTVTLITQTGAGTCSDTIEKDIVIHPIPSADFISETTLICNPDCIRFSDQSSGQNPISSWQWTFNNGHIYFEQNPEPCFSHESWETKYYDVELIVEDSLGCVDSIFIAEYIAVEPTPIADFTYSPEAINTEYTKITFENASYGGSSYLWDFGDNTAPSYLENPEHEFPEVFGEYAVQLIAYGESGTCMDSTIQIIKVDDVVLFYVPNVFTPDGNNYNESFQPIFYSGFDPYDFHLSVFNRWGEIVFESYDVSRGWNGHYGNEGLVKDGVYVWQIQFKEMHSDKQHLHHGHVTVLR